MGIQGLINEINRNVFDCKIEEFNKNITKLYDYISNILPNLDKCDAEYLIEILMKLEDAYKKSDYLLYSDIIEFELKKLIL